MRRTPLSIVLLTAAIASVAPGPGLLAAETGDAPDVQTILAKVQQARGGKASWDAVRTLRIEGTWTAFSEDVPMTIQRMKPDRFRFDHSVLGTPAVLAYDGEKVWVQGEAFGAPDGSELTDDWKRNVVDDAPFGSMLLDHAAQGARIEARGRDKLEGREVLVLGVQRDGWPDETWYVDAETFLETKRDSRTFDVFSGPGIEIEMETYYMDFRTVDGIVIPFREERHFGTRYHVYEARKIDVNPAIDAAVFRLGPPDAAAKDQGS